MIPKLLKEQQAEKIIKTLPRVHTKLSWLIQQLNLTTRTFSTIDLIMERNGHLSYYDFINTFHINYGTWFASEYPSFASALTDTISGLQSINTIINNGLQANYWDPVSDKPVVADISQSHRNSLAIAVNDLLE